MIKCCGSKVSSRSHFVFKNWFFKNILLFNYFFPVKWEIYSSKLFKKFFSWIFKNCCSSTVVSILPPPQPSPPPTLDPTPHWFCPCVLHTCSWKTFLLFPPLSLPTSPLVTVSLFFVSMSLVIFCLLVCLLIRFHLQVRS